MPFDEKLLDRLEQILAVSGNRKAYYALLAEIGQDRMTQLQHALEKRQEQQRQQKLEARLRANNGGNYGSGGYRRTKTQRRRSQTQRRQRRQSRRN